jgi:hypothetical protein
MTERSLTMAGTIAVAAILAACSGASSPTASSGGPSSTGHQ